jgi:hypothetical protein
MSDDVQASLIKQASKLQACKLQAASKQAASKHDHE